MEILDQLEVIGLINPNFFNVSIFCVITIYFVQSRKAKRRDKVPP